MSIIISLACLSLSLTISILGHFALSCHISNEFSSDLDRKGATKRTILNFFIIFRREVAIRGGNNISVALIFYLLFYYS